MDFDLGRFVADKYFPDSFEGKAQWNGHGIAIRLSVETDNETKCTLGALAVSAKTLLAQAEQWDAAAKDKIIEKLYVLWKDTCAKDENGNLNRDEFYAKMQLTSIGIYDGEYFEMEYENWDLFQSQWIMVVGTLSDGIEDAGIAG
tara:strand:- start:17 stop:451 length:435 start_codon:yes stop_codon:yes gene_type:complete